MHEPETNSEKDNFVLVQPKELVSAILLKAWEKLYDIYWKMVLLNQENFILDFRFSAIIVDILKNKKKHNSQFNM